jgi:RimJ/RimL family protein N-acetyltransferase/predicted HD phosphohydrolase
MAPAPEFLDSPILRDAYDFAREAHHGHRREGDTDIEHPTAAARLLHEARLPEEIVAAGLLHDVLEDTSTTAEEIRQRFGTEVADVVGAVTENDAIERYERRKAALRGQVVEAGADASAVFAADKLAKVRALNRAGGTCPPKKLAHYRETLRLLRERRPEVPFLDELASELDELAARVGDTAILRDGSKIMIRPIQRSDAELLARAYERLSEESRRRRFIVAPPRLSDEDLRYLTDVDGNRHDALVAVDPETGDLVGEARYVREPGHPDTAEVAAVVVDDWRGRGVATKLLTDLTNTARERGIARYKAVVEADNKVVLDALAKLGGEPKPAPDGLLELEFEVPAAGVSERLAGALRAAAGGQLRLVGRIAERVARLVPA